MNAPGHDRILIVDDDAEIRRLLGEYLRRHGYQVLQAADGKSMRAALKASRVDLVVLDVMLPGEDGLSLCRDLRARSQLPVIMLSALGEDTERIVGLEMGADDYLAKPFNPRELLARVKGVLRRTRALPAPAADADARRRCFAGWTLDVVRRELFSPEGVTVSLSSGEYRLLKVFVDHPGHVLSRDRLLDLSRGRDAAPFDRSIDVQVGRLRRRLRDDGREPAIIKTVRGEGYVLAAPVSLEG